MMRLMSMIILVLGWIMAGDCMLSKIRSFVTSRFIWPREKNNLSIGKDTRFSQMNKASYARYPAHDVSLINFCGETGERILQGIQSWIQSSCKDFIGLTPVMRIMNASSYVPGAIDYYYIDRLYSIKYLEIALQKYYQTFIERGNDVGHHCSFVVVIEPNSDMKILHSAVTMAISRSWELFEVLNFNQTANVTVLYGSNVTDDSPETYMNGTALPIIFQRFAEFRQGKPRLDISPCQSSLYSTEFDYNLARDVEQFDALEQEVVASLEQLTASFNRADKLWLGNLQTFNTSEFVEEFAIAMESLCSNLRSDQRVLLQRRSHSPVLVGASYRTHCKILQTIVAPIFQNTLTNMMHSLLNDCEQKLAELLSIEDSQSVQIDRELQKIGQTCLYIFSQKANELAEEFLSLTGVERNTLEDKPYCKTLFSADILKSYHIQGYDCNAFLASFKFESSLRDASSQVQSWVQSRLDKLVVDGFLNPFMRRHFFPPIRLNLNYLIDTRKDIWLSPTERLFDKHFDGFELHRANPMTIPGVAGVRFNPYELPSSRNSRRWWSLKNSRGSDQK